MDCSQKKPQDRPHMQLRPVFLSLMLALSVGHAAAQEPALIPPSGQLSAECNFITGEFNFSCIPIYIGYLIQVVFGATAGFALIEIVKSGFQIAWGGIDSGNKDKGKQRLLWALVGLVFSLLAFVLTDFIFTSLTG